MRIARGVHVIAFLVSAAAYIPFSSAQLLAKSATGQITGTVTDPDGALVTGATILLENQITHKQFSANSDGKGCFRFTALSPAIFHIAIRANGFTAWTAAAIVVQSDKVNKLGSIALKIASVNTSVQAITQEKLAIRQVKVEETQRILGIIPNYYAIYAWNVAPLSPKLKFSLAWKTEIDPFSVFASGTIAGVQQWQNDFPGYEQGAQGYGKRFGASYADIFSDIMLSGAILPVILHQDPRYFYKGTGTVLSRAFYAIATTAICKGDNGRWQPNYSNVFGNLASGAVSNLYYPAANRGVRLTFDNALLNTAGGAIGDLAQEFFLKKITPNANKSP